MLTAVLDFFTGVREISAPREALVSTREVKGITPRIALYTAPYGSADPRGPRLGHTDTYVINGPDVQLGYDVLVRTGNPIVGINPEALELLGTTVDPDYVTFRAKPISKTEERRILVALGITE